MERLTISNLTKHYLSDAYNGWISLAASVNAKLRMMKEKLNELISSKTADKHKIQKLQKRISKFAKDRTDFFDELNKLIYDFQPEIDDGFNSIRLELRDELRKYFGRPDAGFDDFIFGMEIKDDELNQEMENYLDNKIESQERSEEFGKIVVLMNNYIHVYSNYMKLFSMTKLLKIYANEYDKEGNFVGFEKSSNSLVSEISDEEIKKLSKLVQDRYDALFKEITAFNSEYENYDPKTASVEQKTQFEQKYYDFKHIKSELDAMSAIVNSFKERLHFSNRPYSFAEEFPIIGRIVGNINTSKARKIPNQKKNKKVYYHAGEASILATFARSLGIEDKIFDELTIGRTNDFVASAGDLTDEDYLKNASVHDRYDLYGFVNDI